MNLIITIYWVLTKEIKNVLPSLRKNCRHVGKKKNTFI